MNVRKLLLSDAAAYTALRLRGLKECPTAFGTSYAEEKRRPASVFRDRLKPSLTTTAFGAFDGKILVGVATLVRETREKEKHKANIYGMYVAPEARRGGVGTLLIETCLRRCARLGGIRQVRLSVSATNAAAVGLYRSRGFTEYGREVDALKVAGRYYDELFLVRRLAKR